MDLRAGARIQDRYIVERELGRGGMATVYAVRHAGLGTRHALKVLHRPTSSIRQRLLKEGRTQGALRHPNVVAVTDLVEVAGSPGLIMEFVHGPTVADVLQARRVTLPEAYAVADALLDAMAAAHEAGVVHRDLKPGNLLLDLVDRRVVPKVADFGLVKILEDDEGPGGTRSGALLGTPAYMAPEQIRKANAVDARADVFAIGSTLYHLLAGTPPFSGDDHLALLSAVAAGQKRPLAEVAPHVPAEVAAVVDACMTTAVDERLADAAAVRDAWDAATAAAPRGWDPAGLAGFVPELGAAVSDAPVPTVGGTLAPVGSTYDSGEPVTLEAPPPPSTAGRLGVASGCAGLVGVLVLGSAGAVVAVIGTAWWQVASTFEPPSAPENRPPSVATVGLSPARPVADAPVQCDVGGAIDPDGDRVEVTYAWAVDGAAVGETGPTFAGPFAAGQRVTCTATPWDGRVSGSSVSAHGVVQAPVVVRPPPTAPVRAGRPPRAAPEPPPPPETHRVRAWGTGLERAVVRPDGGGAPVVLPAELPAGGYALEATMTGGGVLRRAFTVDGPTALECRFAENACTPRPD